ncbi:MAG: hypothetical protein RLY86_3529 [Pseudomonadota bacterium]|jgi:MFS family permease
MTAAATAAGGEFKRGWPVVLAAAVGIGTGLSPIPFYTIGVFVGPLAQEFGWTVGQIMFALLIMTFGAVIMGPVIGALSDRFGVRKVALTSVVLFAGSLLLFAAGTGSIYLFWFNWGLMAVVGAGTLPITWTRAVNNWFNENRGLALGLSLLGTGLFGSFAKLYANYLIGEVGWRGAYVGLALLPLLLSLPIAWYCFRETPGEGERGTAAQQEAARMAARRGLTLRQAAKGYHFWILGLAFIPISFAVGGPIPNLEKLMASKGFDKDAAVQLASLIGPAVIAGRLIGGWLIDRLWAPGVSFVLLSSPAIALWLLTGDVSWTMAAVCIAMIGFAAGVEYDVMAFLVSRYFGLRAYGAIYGSMYGFFALGAGFGPVLFGRSFDATGSYDSILLTSAGVLVVSAASLLLLGRYPDPASFPVAEDQAGAPASAPVSAPSGTS